MAVDCPFERQQLHLPVGGAIRTRQMKEDKIQFSSLKWMNEWMNAFFLDKQMLTCVQKNRACIVKKEGIF